MLFLSNRVRSLAVPMTIEMTKKSRELQEAGHDIISLSLGEPDFDTPDFIKSSGKIGIDENYSHYILTVFRQCFWSDIYSRRLCERFFRRYLS